MPPLGGDFALIELDPILTQPPHPAHANHPLDLFQSLAFGSTQDGAPEGGRSDVRIETEELFAVFESRP